MSTQLNIVIACGGTGGHLFPGIAVAQQLKAMGHNPVLLISRKDVDAEASKKYGDLEFHTVQAIAKPPLLSLRTPGFLWKLLRTYLTCKGILRKVKVGAEALIRFTEAEIRRVKSDEKIAALKR